MIFEKFFLIEKLGSLNLISAQSLSESVPIANQLNNNNSLREVLLVFFGAIGALIAIFLKEAIQYALQKRTTIWQLSAYLDVWRSSLMQSVEIYSIYKNVKDKNERLNQSALEGKSSFAKEWLDQDQKKRQFREELTAKIKESFSKNPDILKSQPSFDHFKLATSSIEHRRQLLIDSKTFISDKDAAILGKTIASNVVNFRNSVHELYLSFEQIFKISDDKTVDLAGIIPKLVDQIILHGEAAILAFIRLEKNTEKIVNYSLLRLMLTVLK